MIVDKKKMRVVNNKTPSVDGKGLMQGRSFYTDDLAEQNSLVIKILRSPHAFARIKNIDVSEAQKINGVALVLTYKDVPHVSFSRAGQGYPEPSPHDKFILDEYVRYVGDEVAMVAANDEDTAIEALKAIKVDYEVLDPVLNFEEPFEMIEEQTCVSNCTIMERKEGKCITNYYGPRSNAEVQDKVLSNIMDDIIDTFNYTYIDEYNSIVLEEKIKDENESISLEEQEQFIKDTAIKYQKSLLNNFSKEPNVMKIYEDNEDIMKALSEINNEQLITAVDENIKLFLEQHSFKYNTEKDKKEILEQKIRQIVDEFYATKIIEVLIQNPNNIKSSCLIIPAQTMPWKKGIFAYNEEHKDNPIRFVMYPYPNGGWAIECVQKSSSIEDRYTKKTPLL